jgi:hypothetical protein
VLAAALAARTLAVFVTATAAAAAGGAGAAVSLAAPAAIFTDTTFVEDVAVGTGAIWAATRGGLEEYDPRTLARRRVLTTADGLDATAVRAVALDGGAPVARTDRAACRLDGAAARFTCAAAAPAPPPSPPPAAAARLEGARVTVTRALGGGGELIGTAGRGLWLRAAGGLRRLTPGEQICGNHVVAVAAWRGRRWFGTFDQGLCSEADGRFRPAALPARMINDLAATPRALYVATTDGLWSTADGVAFRRVAAVTERGINDLAYDDATRWLYATAPNSLWRIPVGRPGLLRAFYRPGGSRSLQAVEARGGEVWLAAEDRGAIRFVAGRFDVFDRAAGLPSSWGLDVALDGGGAAYLGTLRDGVVRVGLPGAGAGAAAARALAGLPDRWILHVSADRGRGGGLWIGTQGGAVRVRADGAVVPVGGVPDPRVHAIAALDDGVWLATEGGTAVYR